MNYLSVKDVAEQLGVDIKTIYRLIRKGDLPAGKIGNVYRLRQSDVDSYVERQFERTRQEVGQELAQEEIVAEETAVSLRCEHCFRLLKDDSQIGGICEQTGCDFVLCQTCVQADHTYCQQHEPTPADKLAAARQAKADGEVPVLVTAVEARRRELNFRDRLDRKVHALHELPPPTHEKPIRVAYWTAVHTTHHGTSQLSTLPTNIESQYVLPEERKWAGIFLVGHSLSHLDAHTTSGFDTIPFTAAELMDLLLDYTTQAEQQNQVIVVGLAATSGWEDEAISLIQGQERGSAWVHRLVYPFLVDLETRAVYANPITPHHDFYKALFALPLPEEEITAVETYVRSTLKYQSSLSASEVQEALGVNTGAVLTAFQRLVNTGSYFIEDVDGIGRVIASL